VVRTLPTSSGKFHTKPALHRINSFLQDTLRLLGPFKYCKFNDREGSGESPGLEAIVDD